MKNAWSRNVALYFACQALSSSTGSLLAATSAIVGAMLAPDPRLATVPAAVLQLATFATTYPASHFMARVGRRAGFSLGAALGLVGAAAAALGILRHSFLVFCAGMALVGGQAGFATFYRFAALESAPEQRRGRALGWVMSAGVLAAFIGPWLASRTKDLWSAEFAGTFAALFAMALASLALLQLLAGSAATASSDRPRAALRDVVRQPAFLTFAIAGMVASAVMVFVMTATPLAMAGCHHGFDHTAHVVQWHVLAMFGPSFLTGRLVARLGAPHIVIAGLVLCGAAAVVNACGTALPYFQIGLFVLGLGWNLAIMGVTSVVAAMPAEARATAQGFNDLLVFSAAAIASLMSGVVEYSAGWRALNLVGLPVLAIVALVVAMYMRTRDRARAPA